MIHALNLVDGHRTLPVLLRDLSRACRVIHVSMFLFFDDPIGREIEAVLARKARAGVAVRVLLNVEKTNIGDPFSTGEERMMKRDPSFHRDPTDVSEMCKRLREAGVQLIDTELDYDRVVHTGDARLNELGRKIRETLEIDALHIDHRKIVTIDGAIAYCGSANFGAQYLFHLPFDPNRDAREEANEAIARGRPEPWWKWHDGFVRFSGAIAPELDRVFHERWRLGGGEDFVTIEDEGERLGVPVERATIHKNEPSSDPNGVRELFLDQIASARERIFIENPYVYHPAIVDALVDAKTKRPSLSVTLIVPGRTWNDNTFAQDAMQHHYSRYVGSGIEVFEYQHHFTHLKLAAFDRARAIVGSANLNYRSLEDDRDFECCVLVESAPFAESIERDVHDVDRRVSKQITEEDLHGSIEAVRKRLRGPVTLAMLRARAL